MRVWLERQETLLAGCQLNAIRFCAPCDPTAPPFYVPGVNAASVPGDAAGPLPRLLFSVSFLGLGPQSEARWLTMKLDAPSGPA